jgi:hypothetical protein
MPDAKRGELVQIHKIILSPGQRPDTLPVCTKAVPYECWIKGFLLDENASIGDEVKIETFIGRELSGTLCQVKPKYDHNFGEPQEEMAFIGMEVIKRLGKI